MLKKISRLYLRYLVVGCFLFFSFITFFSISLTRVAPVADLRYYDPTVFNLIYYIPVTLWIGILGLCCLFLFLFKHPRGISPVFADALMFLIMLLVLLVFFGLPYSVEPNPRFVDSWVHGKAAKYIFELGIIAPSRELLYLTYPSSFAFLSMLSTVSGIELTVFMRFLPPVLVLTFFTFLTIFFNVILRNLRLSVVAVFVFALSTYYLAFHFSPEIFGWLFFLLVLAFLAKGISWFGHGRAVSRSDALTIVFLIVAIALTHPVTQFTLLLLLFTLLTLGAVAWKTKYVSSNLVLFAAIVFVAWAMYFGYIYFDMVVQAFETAFQQIIRSFSSSIAARALAESSPAGVGALLLYRRILYALVPLAALFGGILYFRERKINFNFLSSFLIVSLLMLPFTVFGILPLERSIKLVFLPLSIFAAVFIGHKKKLGVILLAFVLFTIPINFAAVYWGEGSTMTHDWEVSSAKFVSGSFHGVLLGEFATTSIMDYYGNFSRIVNDYSLYGTRPNIFNATIIELENVKVVYITQLTLQKAASFGMEINVGSFVNSTDFACVHSNGYSSVFFREDTTTPPRR